jgi:hypothetical protein
MAKKSSAVANAKKIASKLKTAKKSKSVSRYQSQGQNAPQSKAWTEANDEGVKAKPIGYRWTTLGAEKLGKTATSKPTSQDVQKYSGKTFKAKGQTHRYIYIERRVDKSDKSVKAKFKEGGATKQSRPQSQVYKASRDKKVEAKPVGYRFKGNNYNTPSANVVKRELAKPREDRKIYYETRKDKSDFDFYSKFKKGGMSQSGRQYPNYSEDMDGQKIAKPVGYRYTDRLAKRLGVSPYSRPTKAHIEKYLGRGVYLERREDKTDNKPSEKYISLARGGVNQSGRQYPNYSEDMDGQKIAKPVGYRYTDRLAKRLGVNPYSRPTTAHIEKYLGNGVYRELREDKTDIKPSKNYISLADGGMMARGGVTREGNYLMHFEPYFEKDVKVASIDENSKTIRPIHGYFHPNKIAKKSVAWAKNNGYKFIQDGKEFEDGGMMARGGVERIANSNAREYSENMIPFKGNNLEAKTLDNGDYVVLSYGYYPIWFYSKAENQWYGNSTKYSVTTSKQMSQSRPTYDAKMLTRNDLEQVMMKYSAKFEQGGVLDGIFANDISMQSVGGTSFSTADLTPQMDITNPSF